jgi:hypothetical protein
MAVTYPAGGRDYAIKGGRIEASHDSSVTEATHRVYYVRTDVAAGETRLVTLSPPAAP